MLVVRESQGGCLNWPGLELNDVFADGRRGPGGRGASGPLLRAGESAYLSVAESPRPTVTGNKGCAGMEWGLGVKGG